MAPTRSHSGRPDNEKKLPLPCYRHPSTVRPNHQCMVAILLATIFGCTAHPIWAGNGPGLGLKIGTQTLDHPVTLDKTTRTRYELELASQLFLDDHVDFAFSVGGSSLGSYEDAYVEEVDGVLYEDYYSDDLSVIDVRLAARLYPFGDSRPIRPYVGAGIGYFWFLDSWDDEYYTTVGNTTYIEEDEDTETLADGFFPFILGGMTVPIGSDFEFLFEFQFDFEKTDSGFDLGGPIYMVGARFRF